MNNKGGFLINAVILIGVLIFGVILGRSIGSDSDKISMLEEENRQLAEEIERLQELQGGVIERIERAGPAGPSEGAMTCNSDSDCALKQYPYCCEEVVEYVAGCFHVNVNPPEPIDCTGAREACTGLIPVSSCRCIDGFCQSNTL